jgi:hypothetical protein
MEFCQALVVRAVTAATILLATSAVHAADPKAEIKPALGHATSSPVPADAAVPSPAAVVTPTPPPAAVEGMIERGAYLAWIGGCHDCHTPLKLGSNGPEPDMDRMLSGHPEDLKMPAPPALPAGPWVGLSSTTNTAFAGPWGVSYATNLTPDRDTGMGAWTEKIFVETMRTGRHWGAARPVLPPMPWRNIARLTDDDLRSLFRYLTSVPPIHNRVPDAVPVAAAAPAPKP